MGSFLLLVFAKSFQWQHRQIKCAYEVKKNHTDGFTYTWKANNNKKKSSQNLKLFQNRIALNSFFFKGSFWYANLQKDFKSRVWLVKSCKLL